MNKCEKCGFLHYRTDLCRKPKEPLTLPVGEKQPRTSQPQGTRNEGMPTKSTASRMDEKRGATRLKAQDGTQQPKAAGTQALPVDTNSLQIQKASSGNADGSKPLTQTSPAKFDKKAWMREYMREHRRGIRRRAEK